MAKMRKATGMSMRRGRVSFPTGCSACLNEQAGPWQQAPRPALRARAFASTSAPGCAACGDEHYRKEHGNADPVTGDYLLGFSREKPQRKIGSKSVIQEM